MLALLFALSLGIVEVERVVAVVNGIPVLATDVELARVAGLAPPQVDEDAGEHERAVVEALIDLELRWQDLKGASLTDRITTDVEASWQRVAQRTGGEAILRQRLSEAGLSEAALRFLLHRAAVVQAYVAGRFEPFVRPTEAEIETAWRTRFVPQLKETGTSVPELEEVRGRVEALLREEKLLAEIDRWTEELARRAEVVRFVR